MTAALKSKPVVLKGADNEIVSLPAGRWYINSKARPERTMILPRLSIEARQVYDCLDLATMGFRRELAVTMEGGTKRRLTTVDIARQTRLPLRKVRSGLAELEHEGLAQRRATDGGALRKARIAIYSWAVPRQRDGNKNVGCAQPTSRSGKKRKDPPWVPDSWEPITNLARRIRLAIPLDFEAARDLLLEGEAAARDLKNAELRCRAVLERVRAQAGFAAHQEKGTERNKSERNSGPSSSSGFPAVEEATTTIPPSSSSGTGAGTAVALAVAPVEPSAVFEALSRYVRPDDHAVETLIGDCRKNAPDCTTEEIVGFIDEKAPLTVDKRNPLGYLLKAIPRLFEGGSFRAMRGQPKPVPPKPESPTIRLLKQKLARGEPPW